jgi:hypothetical protein
MLETPYTRWQGDELHGKTPKLTKVTVDLRRMFDRPEMRSTVPDGLDLDTVVPGLLSGWLRSVDGLWLGVVNYALTYTDGRRREVVLKDQLVAEYALAARSKNGSRSIT